ncbi:PREDICTED: uncharacterized protein LOC107346145 [Acropora digitifera]|uniref:uncharacterized protein LOC107346145 n=1 Tax=Acropora digitifera TaxID=70779 RepID=UPI00077AC87D|nr:PREDICTED: uncharacterized protein LOC107346145 [Acropora digitifera]
MSKFKCKCMNITVHVKEKATREADGKAFVSQPVKSTFFSLDLFEVELAVGGITKEVGSLVRETKIEDWNVFSCLNCKMDTHALHVVKKYDRVLISRKMESNPDVFNKNITSPKYSEVFKIVLAPVKSTEEVILDNSEVTTSAWLWNSPEQSVKVTLCLINYGSSIFVEQHGNRAPESLEFPRSNPDVFNKNITSPKYSGVFKIVLAPVKSTEEVILDNSGEY